MRWALSIMIASACGGGSHDDHKRYAGPFVPALDPAIRCPDLAACQTACDRCNGPAQCAADDARACDDLGTRYATGIEIELDPARAATLYQRACDHGRPASCASLGLLYQDGRGVAEDDDRAAALYDRACKAGAGVGCFDLALMIHDGPLDFDQAKIDSLVHAAEPLYEKACSNGEPSWCINLGVLYQNGFLGEPDLGKALDAYHRGCWAGDAEACVNVGLMMLDAGDARAVRFIEAACDDDSGLGCGALGQTLYQGKHVPADPKRAVALLQRGCDLGDRSSCGVLGAIYGLGEKVPKDLVASVRAEQKSCAMGSSMACIGLAADGLQDQKDVADAAGWLGKACAIGDGESCWTLAQLRQRGLAQPSGRPAADEMVRRSCRQRYRDACIVLLAEGETPPVPPETIPKLRAIGCSGGIKQLCDK